MSELILTNAELVLPEAAVRGTVVVRDGVIAEVSAGGTSVRAAVDCDGDLVVPGLVELHTDNMERHIMPRPGAFWPADAAVMNHDREIAAAGITTVLNALCVGEVHTRSMRTELLGELCPAVRRMQEHGALKADHLLHLRCEISYGGLLPMLEPLIDDPALRLVSVMDHTPGQRQFVSIAAYSKYYQGKFGLSDEQLEAFMRERRADQEAYSASNRAAVVAMSKERGVRVASHDDATLEHVDEALRDGIVIAEFPTTVEAAAASHKAGLAVLMGGPNVVRGGSHSGNVSALSLAEAGYLDILSSDYVPASLLFSALKLAEQVEGISLPEAIATVTSTPAKAIGLHDRGEIAAGKRGDLVRVRRTASAPIVKDVWRGGEKIA